MRSEENVIWDSLKDKFPNAYEMIGNSLIKEFVFCRDVINQNEFGYRRDIKFRINLSNGMKIENTIPYPTEWCIEYSLSKNEFEYVAIPNAIRQMAIEFEKIAIKELILKFR
jgi:hypothetical protein